MGKKSRKKKKPLSADNTEAREIELSDKNGQKKKSSRFSAAELLDKTDGLIDEFQYDLAEKFCQRAVEIEPNNIRAIETQGFLLLQAGNINEARACFSRSIELQPDIGHSKYLYMGQMSGGYDAIQFYQTGIQLMKKSIISNSSEVAAEASIKEVTVRDVSNAYCAIAEIYLTDICTDEDAEIRCQENLDLAVEHDPSNPEAFQTMASYLLSKDEKQKAAETMEKSISLWLPQLRNALKPEGDSIENPVEVCLLSYQARISCTKTLIELENYELASEILELLLDENDEVVEVWYLLGLLNYLRGTDFKSNARHYLTKGIELAKKLHYDDIDMLQQMTELLNEIGPGSAEDEDGGSQDEDDGDEMQTDSSSDENGADMEH